MNNYTTFEKRCKQAHACSNNEYQVCDVTINSDVIKHELSRDNICGIKIKLWLQKKKLIESSIKRTTKMQWPNKAAAYFRNFNLV